MRISLLCWESLHSIAVGGVAVHVTELAAALERKGHEVHVFTRMGHGQPHYEVIDGVHYHRCPFRLDRDFVEETNEMCRSFVHHILQTETYMGAAFDVIHAHDWMTANALIWLKMNRQRKYVFTMHSTEYGRCGNNFFDGRSAAIRDLERAGINWADKAIVVSHGLKREIMWMYEAPDWKVSVVFNGVNLRQFDGWIDPFDVKRRYGMGPMDPTVLFCGRMVYQKSPDLMVQAIPYILRYYPNARFVFVGDGEMMGHVQWLSHHLRVAHAARFVGHKSNGELGDLYKACDVVCVPSRNEPFGLVVLEGWSAGKPVVVTKNGGPDEYVWHEVNGLKIYPNPESIAWGVGTLFTNFEWARWMGRNGRIAVESAFTWDAVSDKVLSVYCS
ncbi:MAG: glycosyltransferase family 4 protein [Nitrospiraceae bacterium]|nr:glycosyltransferase family 4 protein [Nitrospiraceae bacterium]